MAQQIGAQINISDEVLAGYIVFLAVLVLRPQGLTARRAQSMSLATETPARPAEKLRVTRSRRNVAWTGAGALVVVVVLALLPYIVYSGTTSIIVQAFILLTLASMWNLLAGYAGLVSVGQQVFVGLGAYFVLILAIHGTSPFAALPVAVIGSGVAALPLWWLVSRLRSGYFAIATWVLAATVMLIIERFSSIGGGTGMPLPGLSGYSAVLLTAYTYWAGLAVTVVALAVIYLLLRGRLGLVLTAIRDDEVAARSSGARVGLARLLVFVVAGAGCGAAGAVLAISQLQVQPSAVFSVQWTAEMAFATIIGGLGTIEGPIVGTALFMVLQQTLASYNAWYLIVLGIVAVVIALWPRRGLWGLVDEHLHLRLFPVGYWLWPGNQEPPGIPPAVPGAPRRNLTAGLGGSPPGSYWNVLLSEMADASEAVAGTSSRLAKIEVLAKALHDAGPAEVTIAVAYLSGELPQRQIGVGWATLREAAPPADHPTLTLTDVDAAFTAIGSVSGKGSVAARRQLVDRLLSRATAHEQAFLFRLLSGELRQGALEGVMAEAIARAAQVPSTHVRRALMLSGSMSMVAQTALAEGSAGLAGFGLQIGRPIGPMLASSAPTIEDALARISPAAVEWKMDGIRIQAHIRDGSARLFTRTLDDITGRLPEVTSALAGLPVHDAVLDGEVIAVREDGRPHPFQVTASRTARRTGETDAGLSAFMFDIVHLDGEDLIDRPGAERFDALARVVPERLRMPRLVTVRCRRPRSSSATRSRTATKGSW